MSRDLEPKNTREGGTHAAPERSQPWPPSLEPPLLSCSQVLPTDTLAGLALRYGVSQSDIRRLNGLLSDSGMYGRARLAIPPPGGLAPPGPALATLAGMIVSGYGSSGVIGGGAGAAPQGDGRLPDATTTTTEAAAACAAVAARGRRVGSEVELTALAGGTLLSSSSVAGAAADEDAVAAGGVRLGGAGAASESLRRRRGGGGPASPPPVPRPP